MTKIVQLVFLVILIVALFFAINRPITNRSIIDVTYSFEYVQIKMPDGTFVEGRCQNWKDYEESDVVQVRVNDKTYLTHYMNVVLVSE